jgi:hypothetical protein
VVSPEQELTLVEEPAILEAAPSTPTPRSFAQAVRATRNKRDLTPLAAPVSEHLDPATREKLEHLR